MTPREVSGWTALPARSVLTAAQRFGKLIASERARKQEEEIAAFIERARAAQSDAPFGLRSIRTLFPTFDADSARQQLDAEPTSAWSEAKRHGKREAETAFRLENLARAALGTGPDASVCVTDAAFDECLRDVWANPRSREETKRA